VPTKNITPPPRTMALATHPPITIKNQLFLIAAYLLI